MAQFIKTSTYGALIIALATVLTWAAGSSADTFYTFDLNELEGTYETERLYDYQTDDSYAYEAPHQWITFDEPIVVSGFILEYSGTIDQYPTYLDQAGGTYSGDSHSTKIYNFHGINFNPAPDSWSGTWRLGTWNPVSYSNAWDTVSFTISPDGSFFYTRSLDYAALGWVEDQEEVGVYLNFFFDIYNTDSANTPGIINITDAQLTIISPTVPSPGALWLLSSGLLGLLGLRKRDRQA